MSQTDTSKHPLIEHLLHLDAVEDRAAMAVLRRGNSRSAAATLAVAPIVERFLSPDIPVGAWERDVAYLIGSLFALHRRHRDGVPFARAFRCLSEKKDSQSIEKRFVALLDAHRDDLAEHLRHAVRLLAAEELGFDWQRLMEDLRHWNHDERWVQRRWARDYWGSRADETPPRLPAADTANYEHPEK